MTIELETASAVADPDQVRAALSRYKEAFDAQGADAARRMDEIEAKFEAKTTERLVRLEQSVAEQKARAERREVERARPPLALSKAESDPLAAEHKSAFDAYIRSGESAGLKTLEAKALSAGSGPDGGYLVPSTVEREVLRRLSAVSPIRAVASVRAISGGLYKRAFSTGGPATGWVGEGAARPQTAAPALAELTFPAMELYAQPAATQTLLDDAVLDIDQWIAEEVEAAFAEQEGAAFVNGDGVNKPKGFLSYETVDHASWSWGKIGTLATGQAGGFPAANPADKIIELVYALRAGYRQNAVFVMNRKTQGAVRKFKDANGNYLWQAPAGPATPATLMGFPVIEAEDMPDIGANSLSIAFGDFRRGYLVVDRTGVRVLRDPFSAKPYVLFYTTKRVGGGVQDFDAIKLMKFGTA